MCCYYLSVFPIDNIGFLDRYNYNDNKWWEFEQILMTMEKIPKLVLSTYIRGNMLVIKVPRNQQNEM